MLRRQQRHLTNIIDVKRLRLSDRIRIAAEIWITYAQVRWLMLRRPIGDVVERLRRGEVAGVSATEAVQLGRRLGSPVIRTLGILPWDSRCLMRSLVLLRMMARRGVACQLVIGARTGSTFAAHAWVEHAGEPLLPTLGFLPLTSIPAASPSEHVQQDKPAEPDVRHEIASE